MDEKKFKVYAHINKINGKAYIGQTSQSLEDRWGLNGNGYLEKLKNGEYKHRKFGNAIIKYGWDNFEHILLETTDNADEIDNLERKYILQYDSMNNGYNCTSGGNANKEVSNATKKLLSDSHRRENLSAEAIEKYRMCKKGKPSPLKGKKIESFSKAKTGSNNPMYGKIPWNKHIGRPVKAISSDGTEYNFNSVGEAAEYFGINVKSNINKCCNGERKYCLNMKWEWTGDPMVSDIVLANAKNMSSVRKRKIIGTSIKDPTVIVEFNSIEDASKFCNLKNSTSIINQLKGRGRAKSAGGYIWKYKE